MFDINNNDKDILIFAKAFPPVIGGIEKYSEEVAKAYSDHCGYRVIVVTQFPGRAGISRRGKIIIINVGVGNQIVVALRFLSVLYGLYQKSRKLKRFKIIHATTWRAGLPVSLMFRHPPLVVSVMGREVRVVPIFLRPLMVWVLNHADLIVGISNTALETIKCPESKTLINFLGLTYYKEAERTSEPKFSNNDIPIIIYSFCRLVDRKNIQGALHALGILKNRGISRFKYRVAGSGPVQEDLLKIVKEENLEDYVEFLGHIPDNEISRRYLEADIFLHPQIADMDGLDIEGFGLTIADAMSFGVAVIAGIDGGPADFIQDNETGILVNGSNHKDIADAVERMILDKKERSRISVQGRDWALKTLSWQKHVDKILKNIPACKIRHKYVSHIS